MFNCFKKYLLITIFLGLTPSIYAMENSQYRWPFNALAGLWSKLPSVSKLLNWNIRKPKIEEITPNNAKKNNILLNTFKNNEKKENTALQVILHPNNWDQGKLNETALKTLENFLQQDTNAKNQVLIDNAIAASIEYEPNINKKSDIGFTKLGHAIIGDFGRTEIALLSGRYEILKLCNVGASLTNISPIEDTVFHLLMKNNGERYNKEFLKAILLYARPPKIQKDKKGRDIIETSVIAIWALNEIFPEDSKFPLELKRHILTFILPAKYFYNSNGILYKAMYFNKVCFNENYKKLYILYILEKLKCRVGLLIEALQTKNTEGKTALQILIENTTYSEEYKNEIQKLQLLDPALIEDNYKEFIQNPDILNRPQNNLVYQIYDDVILLTRWKDLESQVQHLIEKGNYESAYILLKFLPESQLKTEISQSTMAYRYVKEKKYNIAYILINRLKANASQLKNDKLFEYLEQKSKKANEKLENIFQKALSNNKFEENDIEIIKKLLDLKNANNNLKIGGQTLLQIAAQLKNNELVEYLTAKNILVVLSGMICYAYRENPLICAINEQNYEMIKKLCNAGASLDKEENRNIFHNMVTLSRPKKYFKTILTSARPCWDQYMTDTNILIHVRNRIKWLQAILQRQNAKGETALSLAKDKQKLISLLDGSQLTNDYDALVRNPNLLNAEYLELNPGKAQEAEQNLAWQIANNIKTLRAEKMLDFNFPD